MAEHQGSTDKTERIELPSAIQRARWTDRQAAAGGKAGLEVITQFVGPNSEMKIELIEYSGKKWGKLDFKINGDRFWKNIEIPEEAKDALYANVKLPKHKLEKKSNLLIVLPPIEITNVQWDKDEARRGDILKLSADIEGAADGTEGIIEIWEHDEDEAHDFITKIPVQVKNSKVELDWEYEYHEDTDGIPTEEECEKGYNPPEYFFRVIITGVSADSGLLEFKDWIEIELNDDLGNPIPNVEYILNLADGKQRKGNLDDKGFAVEKDVPPGKVSIEFPEFQDS